MFTVNKTTPEAWPVIVDELRDREPRSSRAGDMREDLTVVVKSRDPRERYLVRDDGWNLAFQLQEHFAYWRGLNPGHVDRYVDMSRWLNDDGELPGSAYGDRMRNTAGHDQIARVERQLREDPDTRRAILQVHQAAAEDYDGADVSCTSHLHFFRRDGELHLKASLRSQDIFLGYCYDAANNQALQEWMAGRLGLELGEYHHVMDSAHLYERHNNKQLGDAIRDRESHSMEPLGLPKWRHDAAMELLSSGLERARSGEAPGTISLVLRQGFGDAYADWLMAVTAYEQARFHDDVDTAKNAAAAIDTDWVYDWAISEVESRA